MVDIFLLMQLVYFIVERTYSAVEGISGKGS
jgi:hypothetical protein